jgi:hypothetical protein
MQPYAAANAIEHDSRPYADGESANWMQACTNCSSVAGPEDVQVSLLWGIFSCMSYCWMAWRRTKGVRQ